MARFVFTAVILAGVLATAHPTSVGPAAATATDHTQAAVAEQAAPQATPPTSASAKEIPVGFGWG
jgi:hypothetical protein